MELLTILIVQEPYFGFVGMGGFEKNILLKYFSFPIEN